MSRKKHHATRRRQNSDIVQLSVWRLAIGTIYKNPQCCGVLTRLSVDFVDCSSRSSRLTPEAKTPQRCGFLLLAYSMRHVGGRVSDTLQHEQTKAGAVGESLEPGG